VKAAAFPCKPASGTLNRTSLFLLDLAQEPVKLLVIQLGNLAEGIRPIQHPLLDVFGDFLGEQEQLVLAGFQHFGELADQFFAGEFAEVELVVLDLRDVGEVDLHLLRHVSQRQVLDLPQFSNPLAERHQDQPLASRPWSL